MTGLARAVSAALAVRAPSRWRTRLVPWLVAMSLLGMAAALRLCALGWLPSPAGDEGNWAALALRLAQVEAGVALPSDAAFVSLLFARISATSFRLLGPNFFALRLPQALAGAAVAAATYWLVRRLDSERAARVAGAIAAIHPFCVAWSRTAAVPYGFAFATMLVGPLLVLDGLRGRSGVRVAVGIQVVSLGAHFSPLTACAALAGAAAMVRSGSRWTLRSPEVLLSGAVALLHTAPVVGAAVKIASQSPERPLIDDFGMKLARYLHMVSTGLAAEATVRHFSDLALAPVSALATAVPVVALVAAGLRVASRGHALARFGAFYFALAVVGTPLVLAPGRGWDMRFSDQDRYLFALLPGFILLAASAVAWRPPWGRRLAWCFVLVLLPLATGRIGWRLYAGGARDHGPLIWAGGGGYRGWLVSERARPSLAIVRDAAVREMGPRGGVVLIADAAFQPLRFALDGTRIDVVDVGRRGLPWRRDGIYHFVLWSEGVFAERAEPVPEDRANRALRARMSRAFRQRRVVLHLRQRDGSGLLELWRAEDPVPRLRRRGIGEGVGPASPRGARARPEDPRRGGAIPPLLRASLARAQL